ncbi:hypothetical protein sync_2322 [Synechococcus sp. CC9311]|nr:hypothetical protein sync_2322 [Synechococcus sp. CC9311]
MLYLLTFLEEIGSGSSRIQLSPLHSPSTARIASESVTDLHCCRIGCMPPCIKKFMGDTPEFTNTKCKRLLRVFQALLSSVLESWGVDF